MKEHEVEAVMGAIRSIFKMPEGHPNTLRLRKALKNCNISPPSKNRWIDEAREVAIDIIQERGEATIIDVLEEIPLPKSENTRTIGGVFTHPMFSRIGNRTVKDGRRWKTIGVFAMSD